MLRFTFLQMWQWCAVACYICAKMLAVCICLCARACWRASWRVACTNRLQHEIIDGCVKQFNWIGTPQREFESARRNFSLFAAKNKHIPLLHNAWMDWRCFIIQNGYFIHYELGIIMNILSIYEIPLLMRSAMKVCSYRTEVRILWSVVVYWLWLWNIRKKEEKRKRSLIWTGE